MRDDGKRLGFWRMVEVLEAMVQRHHGFMYHGIYNTRSPLTQSVDEERAAVNAVGLPTRGSATCAVRYTAGAATSSHARD